VAWRRRDGPAGLIKGVFPAIKVMERACIRAVSRDRRRTNGSPRPHDPTDGRVEVGGEMVEKLRPSDSPDFELLSSTENHWGPVWAGGNSNRDTRRPNSSRNLVPEAFRGVELNSLSALNKTQGNREYRVSIRQVCNSLESRGDLAAGEECEAGGSWRNKGVGISAAVPRRLIPG